MRITLLLGLPSLASIGLANSNRTADRCCLTKDVAYNLADDFVLFISNWVGNATYSEELANRTMAPDFEDYNDSVRALVSNGCATGPQPGYSNRNEFEKGQYTVPPLTTIRLQTWFNCDAITFRWVSPQTPWNITGILVLETVPTPKGFHGRYPRVLKTAYSEFNSGSWMINRGVFTPNCTSVPPAIPTSKRST